MQTRLAGVLALVLAGISWAGGSLLSRHVRRAESPLMNTAMQMLCGGALLLLAAVVLGEPAQADWSRISSRSLSAFVYLIIFGSWIGFSTYVWLLRVSTPDLLSTYAYVNPVIAVFLGWALLGEPVTGRTLVAALVIVVGVVIITLPKAAVERIIWWRRRPDERDGRTKLKTAGCN